VEAGDWSHERARAEGGRRGGEAEPGEGARIWGPDLVLEVFRVFITVICFQVFFVIQKDFSEGFFLFLVPFSFRLLRRDFFERFFFVQRTTSFSGSSFV
jgi:hypothetical protein